MDKHVNDKAPNFASIMDETPDHVERPKVTPVGTYLVTVGEWEEGKSSKKGTQFFDFHTTIVDALDDVDPTALEEIGDITGRRIRIRFFATPDSIYRLDQFHENCGINLKTNKSSRLMRNDEVLNTQVLAYISHREEELTDEELKSGKTPRIFAECDQTAPAN